MCPDPNESCVISRVVSDTPISTIYKIASHLYICIGYDIWDLPALAMVAMVAMAHTKTKMTKHFDMVIVYRSSELRGVVASDCVFMFVALAVIPTTWQLSNCHPQTPKTAVTP